MLYTFISLLLIAPRRKLSTNWVDFEIWTAVVWLLGPPILNQWWEFWSFVIGE